MKPADEPEKLSKALKFVEEVSLPWMIGTRIDEVPISFEKPGNQTVVVGSGVVSFLGGVSRSIRGHVVNCCLLAQLAANKATSGNNTTQRFDQLRPWYEVYFRTLTGIGWSVTDTSFTDYIAAGNDLEAKQAILQIAATLFGPAATALAVVQSTLYALRSAQPGRWLTIFKQESQIAGDGRFQLAVVEPEIDAVVTLSLMAFELKAQTNLLQVLLVKLRSSDITLRHASGKVVIGTSALQQIGPVVEARVQTYTNSFVAELPI
jgi:hypothetical protein